MRTVWTAMLVAISMVRDEQDIIGWTLQHLTEQGVDRIIVADNQSKDDTPTILQAFDVEVVDDKEPGYYQARKMTDLAHQAMRAGADWILPFDADEQIYWPHGTLAEFFDRQPLEVGVVEIRGWDYIPQPSDGDEPNPFVRVTYRRAEPQRLPKVAFRAASFMALQMGNHDVLGVPGRRVGGLELKHVQYRSLEQMRRKLRQGAAAYAAAPGLNLTFGFHWRVADEMTDEDIAAKWDALLCEPGLVGGELAWT